MIANAKGETRTLPNVKNVYFFDKDGILFEDVITKNDLGQIVSTKDNNRYAKAEIYSDGTKLCFIKTNKGRRNGEIVADPFSSSGTQEDLKLYNNTHGQRLYEYTLVSEDTLANYTEYLSRKNPARLRLVERRLLNDEA